MESGYGLSSLWTSLKNEEFEEGDVWESFNSKQKKENIPVSRNSSSLISKRFQTATKMIPIISHQHTNNNNLIHHSSAPVNVPDWSKIYGTENTPKSSTWLDDDDDDEDEDDGEGNDFVPPHEWIASRRKSSFSVCEGAGRTLKGRDLSRVRNAVLIKTGFLESQSNYY